MPDDTSWLAPAELARWSSLRFTKRRTEYLLRRWTAKQAVAQVADLAPTPDGLARIEVLNRPTGAPYVRLAGEPFPVDISLTDRAGWAVCLVSTHTGEGVGAGLSSVGCDLELVEPRSDGFVEDFFTAAERDYVWAMPDPDARHAAANLLWSAKESALKVLRTGLRADTRSVQVSIGQERRPDGWAALEVTGRDGRRFPGWWRRDGVFVLTIAYAEPAQPPEVMAASADLATGTPMASWMDHPTAW